MKTGTAAISAAPYCCNWYFQSIFTISVTTETKLLMNKGQSHHDAIGLG